ncbi:MAG: ATP-binding cassette domain-containing protein [Candidatus Coproplasma sp.]
MIEITNLTKVYKSKKQRTVALDNVNLSFGDSGMTFILGKSGCGKTTLLNMLGAIDRFDGGEIAVDGCKLSKMSEKERCAFRNSYVGFIFQEYNLIDDFNAGENVAVAQELQCREPVDGEISAIFDELDLHGMEKRKTGELSGGQRQRVAIARALIKDPRIILADEPTGALDSESGENLMQQLKEISKQRLVIVVSHDRDFAERYGDRIIELKDGRVIGDSSPIASPQSNRTLSLKFARLKSKRAIGMGLRTAVKKPVRLITAVLLLTITVCLLGMSCMITLFNHNEAIKRTIYNVDRDYTVETAKYVTGGTNVARSGRYDVKMLMDDGDLQKYTSLTGLPCLGIIGDAFSFKNSVYEKPANSLSSENIYTFNSCSVLTEQIIQDFNFELLGNLPQAENEIVITQYTVNTFISYGYTDGESEIAITSAEDMIGKTVSFGYSYIDSSDCIVCGVILNLDFDKTAFERAVSSASQPYLKDNLEKEQTFYEKYYLHRTLFVSPEKFESHKKSVDNIYLDVGLIKRDAVLDISNRDLFIKGSIAGFGDLDLLIYGSEKYNAKTTKEVLFNQTLNDGQCVLGLFEFLALVAEYDIPLDGVDCNQYGCTTLNQFINNNFYSVEKIGRIIEEDYSYLITDNYSREYRVEQVLTAFSRGSYSLFGIPFAEILYTDIADVVEKYAVGMTVRVGGTSSMVKEFALAGLVFGDDTSFNGDGAVCLTQADAEEISYGAVDNYYDYLISPMPEEKKAVYALYDDGLSSATGLHFSMENFEQFAVEDFELQLTIAIELCSIVCGILAVFAIILLFNFILSSIAFREKDIRILKNLGAGKGEIFKIFLAESLLTVLLGFILGLAFVLLGIWAFNSHYASFIYTALIALQFEWYVPFLLFGGALIIVLIVLLSAIQIKRF